MVLIIKFLFIVIFTIYNNLYANILFDKNNILITEIDLKSYINFNKDKDLKELTQNQLLKEIYLIKKTIIKLKKNNALFIEAVDKAISSKSTSAEDFNLDLLRFTFIRNDFIKNYYQNNLTVNDVNEAIKNTKGVKVPFSLNNCLTIEKTLNIKDLKNFDETYFNKLKDPKSDFFLTFDNKKYDICLNQSLILDIEYELVKVIVDKTELDFKSFIYEK